MLAKERLRPACRGEASLLVLTVPAFASVSNEELDVYAIPVEFRQGGLLLALPADTIADQVLTDGQTSTDEVLFGPNSFFSVDFIEETEDLASTVPVGIRADVLVIDVTDQILSFCREYDPVTDSMAEIHDFSSEHPLSIPEPSMLAAVVREWLVSRSDDRTGFYTAQEDQPPVRKTNGPSPSAPAGKRQTAAKRVSNAMIADQLSTLVAQMQVLTQRQDRLEKSKGFSAGDAAAPSFGPTSKLPAVSAGIPKQVGPSLSLQAKALTLVGPPPKVRTQPVQPDAAVVEQEEPYDALLPGVDESAGIAAALTQQSTAITALVAHLASQSTDALGDLTVMGSQSGTTKGVQRRERMQNDLANGTSGYFVQLLQQLHRRLHPSRPVPQSEEELAGVSMLTYLERQGGYRHHRELGLVAWILGHAVDSAAAGDFKHTKEILALLMVAVEQAVIDRGDWTLAYMMTLLEEPPLQMFQERSMNMVHHSRPFGPLVPPQWTAVCLAYLKDLEVLATKKSETAKKNPKGAPAETPAKASEPEGEESPRRNRGSPRSQRQSLWPKHSSITRHFA